jgi:hypothetical protein
MNELKYYLKPLPDKNAQLVTANKRNCLTKLYLDNRVLKVGSIRLFAKRYVPFKNEL